jgi:alkyl hydroperoxide reductase subunit F
MAVYDLIIIGAGPAGMTAAIYAARQKLRFLMLSMDLGGQMSWSSEVDNYPGVPDQTGIQLTEKFQEHMRDYKIKMKTEEVKKLEKNKKTSTCRITTAKNTYESRSVIIASGKSPRKLGVPGEEELTGKGVNYCATCDAPLYKDKKAAVVGGGNSGLEAALFLAKYAKKVYILDLMEKLGGEPYLREKVEQNKKITFLGGVKIKEIVGDKSVKEIVYEKQGKEEKIECDGVFIEVGLVSKADFTDVQKNKWGEIMIYRSTITNEENLTDTPGIFAAGDVTDIPSKQIIVAAGEGAKAALACFNYLAKNS